MIAYFIVYIVDGIVITYTTAGSPSMILKDTASSTTGSQSIKAHRYGCDVLYGKELMSWASTSNTAADTVASLENLPISTKNVRCHTKVEGFVLTAIELKTVLDKLEKYPEN